MKLSVKQKENKYKKINSNIKDLIISHKKKYKGSNKEIY
jgi:hypothetical protein